MIKESGYMLNNQPINEWNVFDMRGNLILTNSWMLNSNGVFSFIYASINHSSENIDFNKIDLISYEK